MRLIGRYKDTHIVDDEMVVSFAVDGSVKTKEELETFADEKLVLQIDKYRKKHSMSANGYFWVLVDQIARATGSDKESVYLWLIRDAGVSVPLMVVEDALPTLSKSFRLVEEIGRSDGMVEVLCYFGVSQYDTKEMAHIIDIARQDATRLGIDVWTEDEIRRLYDNTADDNTKTS